MVFVFVLVLISSCNFDKTYMKFKFLRPVYESSAVEVLPRSSCNFPTDFSVPHSWLPIGEVSVGDRAELRCHQMIVHSGHESLIGFNVERFLSCSSLTLVSRDFHRFDVSFTPCWSFWTFLDLQASGGNDLHASLVVTLTSGGNRQGCKLRSFCAFKPGRQGSDPWAVPVKTTHLRNVNCAFLGMWTSVQRVELLSFSEDWWG